MKKVKAFGFPDRIAKEVGENIKRGAPSFDIFYCTEIGEDQLTYRLAFQKKQTTYQFTHYELIKKNVPTPELHVQGIDTKEIEKKLKEVDRWYDSFLQPQLRQPCQSKNMTKP